MTRTGGAQLCCRKIFVLAVALLLVRPAIQAANLVTDWNEVALDAIRFASVSPPVASRYLCLLHTAIYAAMDPAELGAESLGERPSSPKETPAQPSAANAAAHDVLVALLPGFRKTFDAHEEAQAARFERSAEWSRGVAHGKVAARQVLRARQDDGSAYGIAYQPPTGPGRWQATPPLFASALLPNWADLRPFSMTSPSQFRPPPPPALTSPQWVEDFNQVKALGAARSTRRTPEQTAIAYFWSDDIGTVTPPGHWNHVAQQLAEARQLSLTESARLFGLLNTALGDAAIAAWEAKYTYEFWRPVTAIREAAGDGNPETVEDRDWTPLLNTPPFPEYISGHSTFSGAAAEVLATFNGSDEFEFDLRSNGIFATARHYRRFSEAAAEAGMSRIYGGIHFPSANREGLATGRSLGRHVVAHFQVPRVPAELSLTSSGIGSGSSAPKGNRSRGTSDLNLALPNDPLIPFIKALPPKGSTPLLETKPTWLEAN